MTRVLQTERVRSTHRRPDKMPWVCPAMCDGCGECVRRCPRGVLQLTETNVEGVFVPWLDDPEACSGCGLCARGCVSGGIRMTTYVEQATSRFVEKRPIIPG